MANSAFTNGGATWGGISGTLADQTDLQTALNGKQGDITLTTTGTSGAATLIGDTLNIPNYADTDTGITQITGDVTAGPGSGSQAATLATVNANVGQFGSATAVSRPTVNAKGLVTAIDTVAIAIPSTAVTDFTEAAQDAIGAMVNTSLTYTDGGPTLGLTSRTINGTAFDGTANIVVTAAAGTLTGATLAAGVTASSLTSVGTIGTGVWQGTAIADAYIASAATWNAKQSAITFGTGVQTALGVNIGSAGAPVLFNGAGGTPSSLVGTNITGTAVGLSIGGNAATATLASTVTTNANLTGDVTSVGNATTLATVNAGSGSVGSSTAIPVLTTNAKGLVTAQTTAAVVAPASTLTGATLAAGVTASSLTSVGTITSGTWNGTDIAVADGGTGRSTSTTAYGLIAAGTTATGAHQTLAAGATTEILVGGGASALPVWTTASGTGAPLRQGTPTITTPNIVGITSVAAAAAGSLGEIVTGSAGAVALVNNTAKTLSSITLSAGVWNIYGYVDFGNSATTTVTLLAVCVNTTTDTFTSGGTSVFCNGGLAFNTATTFCSAVLNPRQVNISGSTTYYMVGFATFGVSTCSGTPTFWAERVR